MEKTEPEIRDKKQAICWSDDGGSSGADGVWVEWNLPSAKRHILSLRHKHNWRKFVFFLSRISFSLIWRLFKMHEHSSAPSNLRNWFDTYLQIIYTYTRVKLRAPTLNRTSIGVKHELALARSLTSRQTNCIKAWESLSLSVTLSIFDTPSVNAGAWGKLRLENYTKNAIDIDSMWTGKSEQSSRKKTMYFEGKKVEFLLMNAKFDLSSRTNWWISPSNWKCKVSHRQRGE